MRNEGEHLIILHSLSSSPPHGDDDVVMSGGGESLFDVEVARWRVTVKPILARLKTRAL